MSGFRLLLLDANVVICLFELGLWDKIVKRCDVHLSATVVGEADFFIGADGMEHEIDLRGYVESGAITIFEVPLEKIREFFDEFSESYAGDLDPGEAESLTYLLNCSESHTICSADHIVFQVLGSHCRSDQGISLQELLERIGETRRLKHQFTKAFREKCTRSGFADGMQGRSSSG